MNIADLHRFLRISIHAPAKGATPRIVRSSPSAVISIHAPAKGATCISAVTIPTSNDFNPRSREGSDLRLVRKCRFTYRFQSTLPRRERRPISSGDQTPYCISIHAPAKGATKNNSWKCRYWGISIHAPAKGATR